MLLSKKSVGYWDVIDLLNSNNQPPNTCIPLTTSHSKSFGRFTPSGLSQNRILGLSYNSRTKNKKSRLSSDNIQPFLSKKKNHLMDKLNLSTPIIKYPTRSTSKTSIEKRLTKSPNFNSSNLLFKKNLATTFTHIKKPSNLIGKIKPPKSFNKADIVKKILSIKTNLDFEDRFGKLSAQTVSYTKKIGYSSFNKRSLSKSTSSVNSVISDNYSLLLFENDLDQQTSTFNLYPEKNNCLYSVCLDTDDPCLTDYLKSYNLINHTNVSKKHVSFIKKPTPINFSNKLDSKTLLNTPLYTISYNPISNDTASDYGIRCIDVISMVNSHFGDFTSLTLNNKNSSDCSSPLTSSTVTAVNSSDSDYVFTQSNKSDYSHQKTQQVIDLKAGTKTNPDFFPKLNSYQNDSISSRKLEVNSTIVNLQKKKSQANKPKFSPRKPEHQKKIISINKLSDLPKKPSVENYIKFILGSDTSEFTSTPVTNNKFFDDSDYLVNESFNNNGIHASSYFTENLKFDSIKPSIKNDSCAQNTNSIFSKNPKIDSNSTLSQTITVKGSDESLFLANSNKKSYFTSNKIIDLLPTLEESQTNSVNQTKFSSNSKQLTIDTNSKFSPTTEDNQNLTSANSSFNPLSTPKSARDDLLDKTSSENIQNLSLEKNKTYLDLPKYSTIKSSIDPIISSSNEDLIVNNSITSEQTVKIDIQSKNCSKINYNAKILTHFPKFNQADKLDLKKSTISPKSNSPRHKFEKSLEKNLHIKTQNKTDLKNIPIRQTENATKSKLNASKSRSKSNKFSENLNIKSYKPCKDKEILCKTKTKELKISSSNSPTILTQNAKSKKPPGNKQNQSVNFRIKLEPNLPKVPEFRNASQITLKKNNRIQNSPLKLMAIKVNTIDIKYTILCKEQAGFKIKEECVAQATTLYEIIKRRKLEKLETYIGFIDLEKAYDRVPHDQLFHKLEYSGIRRKLLQYNKGLYHAPCTKWIKKYNGNIKKIKNTIETLNNRQKKNDKSQISKWIADTEAARRYAKSGFIEKIYIEECPFCRNIAPETIEHMLLECTSSNKTTILPALISMRLVGRLLGEELKLLSTRICKDPTVLCVKTTLATAKFLNAIALPRYLMLNSMKYTPFPLNKAAMPVVRKNDAALYGIQMALANMTRPIDNYVHKKLKNPATRIKGNDDLEFAHLMRELLFDVASNITQAQIKNIHKSMGLQHSKRFQQRTETEIRAPFVCTSRMCMPMHLQQRIPLKTPPKLQTIQQLTSRRIRAKNYKLKEKTMTFSKATRILRRMKTTLYVLSRLGQTHIQQVGQEHSGEGIQHSVQESDSKEAKGFNKKIFYNQRRNNQGGCGSSSKKGKQTDKKYNTRFLQPSLNRTKEEKRPLPSSRPPETQQLCRGKKFQNGIPDIHMQDDQEKGLYDLSESRERFYAHSDTPEVPSNFCSSVWALTESAHLYKGATQVQKKMYGEYKEIILQTKPTGVQDQDGEVQYDTISINYLSGNNDKLTSYESESSTRQGQGSQMRSQQTDQSWQNNTEKLASFIGKAQEMSVALLPGRLMLRRLLELKNNSL
ncbi:hypothetical protein BB561_003888 [Smittium simulii]|uniref:Uncharacterized protein n=1 Tax=Smittium simulii TaxID=133385 RepID=A0A2T9YJ50_9FUNG|nr:hypothetical protein BB561_003888 [Smittium simulii]